MHELQSAAQVIKDLNALQTVAVIAIVVAVAWLVPSPAHNLIVKVLTALLSRLKKRGKGKK